MAGSRYSQSVDLNNWNSSHSLAVLSVPPGSRVLDLGAADGSVARALRKRGCTVWGIERDEQAAKAALQVCDRVIVADLEAKESFEALGSETFDVVLALDVLEHLRDPAPVLKCAASYLTPGGIAVVSIPNVTHGALRLSLLEGRFDYTEQGLLDRTHLRFFDRHAAEQLMSEAGLTISQHLRVRRGLDETEIAVNKEGLPIELLQSLASDPDATTYQFVFVAGRTNGSAIAHSGGMLSERLLAENEELRAQYRELEMFAKSLQQKQAQSESLQVSAAAKNEALLAQVKELETYTKNLEADLAARLGEAGRELKERQDELAQTRSMQTRTTAESVEVQRERDELRQELIRRTQEAHQMHRDLRHSRADLVVKDAFISDLRRQLAERDELAAGHKRLSAKCKQLVARRDQLVEDRRRLLARQEALETNLRALQTYTSSAGFRIVENVIRHLRRFPTAFRTTRTIARKVVGRSRL
ncbi:MAG TPA: methyltransferase domain-containing protein [Gemmatimonadaceae bacterium]|nr:methyltransferase domain-containing protein [Gemmatimonadaceae bacterium]